MRGNNVETVVVTYESIGLEKLNKFTKAQSKFGALGQYYSSYTVVPTPGSNDGIFALGVGCIHCSSRECRLQLGLRSISDFLLPHSTSHFAATVRRQGSWAVEGSSVSSRLRCGDYVQLPT
jgi:hypothetical protein